MALTDKEIEHFNSELPEGMRVVDFREINGLGQFIEKFCTLEEGLQIPFHFKASDAIIKFIEHVKQKK